MTRPPGGTRRRPFLVGGVIGLGCAAAVYAAAVNAAAAHAAAVSAQEPSIRITYLANEGVMLQGRGGRVLIDALFGEGLPEYAVVPESSRDSLERAVAQYGGPALVLTTHPHRDHFDSAAVARYLAANPRAVALPAPDTIARTGLGRELDWVRVRRVAIPHGPTRRPVGHSAWLVTLDGVTALHIGDAGSEPGSWPPLGLGARGLDVALVPYWYALDEDSFHELFEVLRPRTVVLLHVPLAAESGAQSDLKEAKRELHRRYPQVRTPTTPGQIVLTGGSAR